ncbi:MAG: hypothetical protein N2167_09170 [Flavobacteriales bacterium]|nr:hypothetical protein [Flavobacteriales bacterium]
MNPVSVFKLKYVLLLVTAFLLAGTSCSTKKNKFLNRFWHSMNTKYNGYFNGSEAIKLGIQELVKARKDNFTKIIPVYEYGDKSNFSSQNAQWDRAIKKGVVMIKKHSMLINGKQYNRYIDDCYLMMGIAHYFKLDFDMGIGQLRYVAENSEKNKTRQDARIWIVRSYLEQGELAEAATAIRQVDKGALDKKQNADYWASIADYHIRMKEYNEALEDLNKAIEFEKKKKRKARYQFIRGQLYQQLKENQKAYESFAAVLKLKPEYELEFQSKINMARTAGNDSNEDLKKLLKKMLKDDKNIEYQDQIYYALGTIFLKEKNKEEAIKNFKKSVAASVNNKNQKGLSYLELARIYFADRKYEPAQAYYDSTSTSLDKDHPEYESVMRLKENLTEVVLNIRIIQLQDSLQRLAALNEKDLMLFLENYVEDLKAKDEEAKNNVSNNAGIGNNAIGGGEGKWYFYNNQALAFGLNEFKKVWGNRPLEDDWRRSNKNTISFNDGGNSQPAYNPRYDPQTYLAEIPRTDSALQASREMLWQALYNLGLLYKEKIFDYELSAESFEDLVKRNTNNIHFPVTYYQLYLVYKELKNTDKSEYYKNLILRDYPTSEYARILGNPDYMLQKEKDDDKASPIYESAYFAYKSKNYNAAISLCDEAKSKFPESKMLHRFALLRTLARKELVSLEEFKKDLKDVKDQFPGTESAQTAARLLKLLIGEEPVDNNVMKSDQSKDTKENVSENKKDSIPKPSTPFTKDLNAEHIVIIIIPSLKGNINVATQKLNQFNDENFSNAGLSVNTSLLGNTSQVMLIRKFKNGNEAINYFSLFNKKDILSQLQLGQGVKAFPITMGNYALLFKSQDVSGYEAFYHANYPK